MADGIQNFLRWVWEAETMANAQKNPGNFAQLMARYTMAGIQNTHRCVMVCREGARLVGSQANRVQQVIVTGTGFAGLGNVKFRVYAVPKGVKVNLIRNGPDLMWSVWGEYNRGSGAYEAHIWVPNWASKPWL